MRFFHRIFELAPEALGLFSFKDEGVRSNGVGLRLHALKVMKTVGVAVSMLRKLDELVPVLQEIGTANKGYGVLPAHYPVVGEALLWTLEQGLVRTRNTTTRTTPRTCRNTGVSLSPS